MHYHCSEQERDGEKTAEPPGMWEDDGPAAGGWGVEGAAFSALGVLFR